MAKLVDARDLKSLNFGYAGSIPAAPTNYLGLYYMLAILFRFIIGNIHNHNWITVETRTISNADNVLIGNRYYLKCTKCGIYKSQRF